MMRRSVRYGLLAAGVFATLLAGAGVIFMVMTDSQVAGSVVARPAGWVAPLVALSVIVGVSWILLGQPRASGGTHPGFERTRCQACEREVLGQWRMCPYCGVMLNRSSASPLTGSGAADQ